ncbi:MAG: UvrD-helicase domain-containing protein [Acidimicrobiales bacterium]
MTEEVLVDLDDREMVATDLDRTVFAVAGAGSGKTRHLVERVVNVLVSGRARVDQIAVITFTEAAAAQLLERIGHALDDLVTAPDTDALVARRAAEALGSLEGAAVTTLHGFARRILSEHPFDAGLPPTFEVLDEARSLADLDEHWVGIVEALLADPQQARAVQWALVAGGDLATLRVVVRRMGENWDRLLRAVPGTRRTGSGLPGLDAAPVVQALQGALALEPWCTDAGDSLLAHLESLRPYLAQLERAGSDELRLLGLLVRPPRRIGARSKGVASAWQGHKAQVVALLDDAQRACEAAAGRAVGAAMAVLGDALGELAVGAARRRQREGRLQFHDLLVLACELVRHHREVRAALHDQYRHLFVDEYQDTDPLQAELVTMIAAEPSEPVGEVPWWQLTTSPGALFFVGDPLQSIYAFRRADVGTFLRTLTDVATTQARLVTNFRSVPGIVACVNEIFGRIVGDGEPGQQPPYMPSRAARDAVGTPPRAVSVVGAGADHEISAPMARAVEAEEVAAVLRRAVSEGWPVGAGGRPVRLDDIAVLVPTRTSVPALVSAFDAAGIDYRLESSSLVYDTREVQDLLHVLRAVDDPSDVASVVAALRSPGFGCGDDDLLRHRSSGGVWDYRLDPPPGVAADDPVRRGLLELRSLHAARSWTSVSELVTRVVDEARLLDAALDEMRWREEWRRLRFVVDQARQFTESSPATLRQYLAWVEVQRDEDARVTEVVLPETDVPAVSVMTVHAAKGLEFPMVAVLGFGAATRGVTAPAVLWGDDRLELALRKTLCTAGYEAARMAEQHLLERERLRLLYVALTRAQNHLVVSVHRPQRSAASAAEALEDALLEVPHLWEDARAEQGGAAPPSPAAPSSAGARTRRETAGAGDASELERWRHDRCRRLGARPAVMSATAVAKLAAEAGAQEGTGADGSGSSEEPDDVDGTADGVGEEGAASGPGARALWRRGRAGTSLGRAVHAVLQTVDLHTGAGLDPMAQAHAAAEGVASRWEEVAALARTALESEIVRRAVQGRFWRELYVGAPFGGGVLEGFVDLLFEGPDGLEVVDYKTDQVRTDAEVARLATRYRLQGAAYAAAVQAATGRPVRRCTFLFLRAGEAVARCVEDLAEAMREVEAIVVATGTPPAAPTPAT